MTNIFNGVPHNHQASGVFPSDPTITYFFYYDGTINKVYKHDSTSNTTTIHDIGSGANQLFPSLPTTQAMDRAVWDANGKVYVKWEHSPGVYHQRSYTSSTTSPQGAVSTPSDSLHNATTANTSFGIGISTTSLYVNLPNNGWALDHQYNQGSWGGTTAYYTGLPQTQHRSMNMIPGNNNQVLVFYDTGIVYTIDLSTKQVVSSAPYGASVGANYLGMNYNLDCVCYDAWDETTIMAFKGDVIQFFTNEVLTSTQSRLAMFPQIGTSTVSSVYRSSVAGTNPNTFWQLYFYDDAGTYWRYETTSLNPTGYTFLQTGSHPWMSNVGPRGEGWQLWFKLVNGVAQVDLNGNTGAFVPYGPGTSYYPTLPNTQVPDACWHNTATGVVYVSIIDTIYLLDTATTTVTSFAKYNVSPPVTPPTPLPDIEVVYSAPSQFNLFSNNVALVTETQYGWNFTKTILNSDKMELYLYHSSAPGAVAFNYDQLRDIQVNMKNNLALPTGEIFVTVWTGPPVAPNWYNYKDIYNMTPPLGTTVDLGLVLTTLNLTDHRTDPILAIALHSNSSQQQVNCDVERVSFDILLPTNNNSQRVIVKLENNFIVVDDKYWNLDQTANGYTGNTLTAGPTWEIKLINPNIIAGNYPQTASFSQADSGTAWYLKDTFTNWTTTDNITWTNSGNTTKFVNTTGQPGVASNGASYPKCNGVVTNTGNWPDQPISWEIDVNNLLAVRYATGGQVKKYSKLSELPTPNNFTPAQIESGCFSSSETGVGINVFISSGPPPATMTSLVFDKPGIMTINSETEMLIRRDWELADTLYSINVAKPNSLTGQYFDPAFPIAYTPDNYVMPSNWSVIAESSFRFEILFSGGLNNSIPAVNQNSRQMTVTPTPSNAALTFTWVANYYTAGDVLISPVLNITTTGLVSSFITGGSLKPANAAYILYGCTSSENVDAFTSIVFIEPEPITLQFSGGISNNITTGGGYNVTALPNDSQSTYTFTARFYSKTDVDLGLVPGATTTANQSSFTINYATLPANVGYIYYTCKAFGGGPQDQSEAALTINIEEIAVEPFILEFNSLSNQIDIDGTYSVKPSPVDATTTYAYTAEFRDLAGTSLGAVPGAGASGISSPFTITFATLPAGVKYIDYNATATGGAQDGSTAQLSIAIIEPCPPIPPDPESDNVVNSRQQNTIGIYENKDYIGSSKKVMDENVSSLDLQLVDGSDKTKILINNTINYEIETSFKGEF